MINRTGGYKLFRWSDGSRTLTLRVKLAGGNEHQVAPRLPRWRYFFCGYHGGSHVNFSYKRVNHER